METRKMRYFRMLVGLLSMSLQAYGLSPLLNQKAPLFKAQAVFPPDHKIGEFDLKKYIGQHKIVLYFYPMDSTPGCTKQAEKFRDDVLRLQEHGIIVIGISCDSLKSHQKFQEKYKLPFILVHDSRWYRKVSKMYDAAGWFYCKRKTYLIDKDGVIVHVFEKVDIKNQIDEILEVFEK